MIAKIYDRWIADSTLSGLVPDARVFQGFSLTEMSTYPYVSIQDSGNGAPEYTSSGVIEQHGVRFDIYDTDLDNIIENILPAIRAEYNRQSFTNHRGTTVNLQWQNDVIMYDDSGVYRGLSNYFGIVQATSGA